MARPIVLPELPKTTSTVGGWSVWYANQMAAYARDAVEADRKGIAVTDEDVEAAMLEWFKDGSARSSLRAALESFAARLRGET